MKAANTKRGVSKAKDIYEDRFRRAKELKAEGKKIVGYFCSFVPLEIITATGIVPFRILGNAEEPITKADTYITSAACPFLRSCFDIAFKGEYDFLDGIVSCYSCEGVENCFPIWRYYFKPAYAYIIDMPHGLNPWDFRFFREEIDAFKRHFEAFAGCEITEESLRRAIHLHNENRALVRELYDLRKEEPPLLTGSEVIQTLVAAMSVPVNECNDLLRSVIDEVRQRVEQPNKGSVRLFIWGSPIDNARFMKLIEECGANVVMDDLCVGSRHYWADVEATDDIVGGLSRRYLDGVRCPRTLRESGGTYKEDNELRFNHLKKWLTEFQIDGAILQTIRFCDPCGWEIPDLKVYLEEQGVPVLILEHEYSVAAIETLRTRIEAFIEMTMELKSKNIGRR